MSPQLFDVGNRVYVQDTGVATLGFTPYTDRAAKVTRVSVTNPSAPDVWTFDVGGAKVASFLDPLDVTQRLLGADFSDLPNARDIFSWHEQAYGKMLEYPVPNGQLFTVSSVNGATADICIEYMEVSSSDVNAQMENFPRGKNFCTVYTAFVAASTTEAAETNFNAESHIQGFPNLFSGTPGQTGYDCKIKALWPQSGTVSSTTIAYLYALMGEDRWFTRSQHGGLTLIGDSGALGIECSPLKQFQNQQDAANAIIDPPIHIPPGMISQWGYGLSAGAGSTDDISGVVLHALVDVTVMS